MNFGNQNFSKLEHHMYRVNKYFFKDTLHFFDKKKTEPIFSHRAHAAVVSKGLYETSLRSPSSPNPYLYNNGRSVGKPRTFKLFRPYTFNT